jgi:DtxR family transcriptional regulator, Mn-dependent transcriptional regulator
MTEHKSSPAVEEYLETIYRLTEGDGPANLTTLAERLAISPVSTNEMVRKLVERDLATYEPYKGVSLTAAGAQKAESIIRRHRLWERLLTDVLGMPWDQVHEEACRLEHATSDLLEERLSRYLEQPTTCPHGVPMPGRASLHGAATLLSLSPNQSGRIVAVLNEDAEFLRALGRAAIQLGAEVRMVRHEPTLHSVICTIDGAPDGAPMTLDESVAEQICVAPVA